MKKRIVLSITTVLAALAGLLSLTLPSHAATSVQSLWTTSTVPTSASSTDPNSVNVGLRFHATVAGQITGVRFYKGASNTGTHVGSLWTAGGTRLESVTFTNETATGWQTANFATPVSIVPSTTYVVSYLAPVGHYAFNENYFATSSHYRGNLVGNKSNSTYGNGVYTYSSTTARPTSSYKAANYWVDVLFVPSATSTISASPSVSATSASPSPTQTSASPTPTQTSSSPSPTATSASPSPTGTFTATYVQPGSVGYLGATSDLTVYQPGGAAPAGCSWLSYGLRCDDDNYTWDHVWIKGGVYWTGLGQMKVTNSIIQGSSATGWYALLGHPASGTTPLLANAGIDVENSTLGWLAGDTEPSGQDVAPVWSLYGNQPLTLKYDDLSGMPQGTDPGADSVIEFNWIHNMNQNGSSSTPSHIDGVYSQGGGNILIEGNYIDVPVRSDVTAAVFIQDRGATDTGIQVIGNYLNGGAYNLRNQTGAAVDVENNTFGQSLYGYVGDLSGYPGTYGTWSGNVDLSGNTVPKP